MLNTNLSILNKPWILWLKINRKALMPQSILRSTDKTTTVRFSSPIPLLRPRFGEKVLLWCLVCRIRISIHRQDTGAAAITPTSSAAQAWAHLSVVAWAESLSHWLGCGYSADIEGTGLVLAQCGHDGHQALTHLVTNICVQYTGQWSVMMF